MTAVVKPARGALRAVVIFLVVFVMVSVAALALASLLQLTDSNGSTTDDAAGGEAEPSPAGPEAVSFASGFDSVDGVTCGRPASASADASFRVEVVNPDEFADEFVVGVELVETESGGRQKRTLSFPRVEPGRPQQAIVSDSDGAERFSQCLITAIQRDHQVILTGH